MNTKQTLVSVIIPTYKPKDYLWKCIDSIAKQTIGTSSIELIIVLNGCHEPYLQQIESYTKSKEGLRTILIHTEIPGVSNARNIAISKASGEYISFIDDDDWISDCYLQQLINSAEEGKADMVEANVADYDESTDTYHDDYLTNAFKQNKDSQHLSLMAARRFLSSSCCKIIRRSVIANARFDCKFAVGEDSLFMAAVSKRLKDIRTSPPDAIYFRRIRQGSASRKDDTFKACANRYSKLAWAYTKLLLTDIFHYNWIFFATRYVALLIHVLQYRKSQ